MPAIPAHLTTCTRLRVRSIPTIDFNILRRGNRMSEDERHAEPPYARYLGRLVRYSPNFDFFFIKPVRRKAVHWLQLGPGDRVLDLGCGGGGSLPHLVHADGPKGVVLGVDVSPQSCRNARQRIKRNRWENVEIVEGAAQRVQLSGTYDGVLMFAAPDVFASEAALANVLPHLRDGARIVFFGAKLSDSRLGAILNPLLQGMVARLSPATPVPDERPWTLIAEHVDELRVEQYFGGSMFLASGTLKKARHLPSSAR
jgi:SAM-dependent methyltransferase